MRNLIKKSTANNYFSINVQQRVVIINIIQHRICSVHHLAINSINTRTEHAQKVHHHWITVIQKLVRVMKM